VVSKRKQRERPRERNRALGRRAGGRRRLRLAREKRFLVDRGMFPLSLYQTPSLENRRNRRNFLSSNCS
jgi:hypothetical protein